MELEASKQAALQACIDTDGNRTLPPFVYHDEMVADLEQKQLFNNDWFGIGRTDRWPHVGDFSEFSIGDVPVVVVREATGPGGLRALSNVCLHRSMLLTQGSGNTSRLRCPFHAWTYELDGRLAAAPEMHRTAGFVKSDYYLRSFAVEERAGFVFMSFDDDPQPLEQWLHGFDDLHAPWPLGELVTTRRREFAVACNWKLFAEVFNEYYHLPYVHETSLEGYYNDPDDPEDVAGSFATQFGETNGTPAILAGASNTALPHMPGLSGRPRQGVRYTWLYPNVIVAIGVEVVWMYEVYPDGPDRCQIAQVVCFPPETIAADNFEARVPEYYKRFDVAIAEDIPVLEAQQRGMLSPFAEQGPISRLEPVVGKFANWYATRLLEP